ncbi:MAG: AI-2E family transporter, partial [Acutalibacteraceae bacterium]
MEEQAKKSFIINVIFIGLWGAIFFYTGKFLLHYLLPFVVAGCVAAIMQSPAEKIAQKTRLRKGIVAAILSAILYLAVAAICVLLIFKIFSFTGNALANINNLGTEATNLLNLTQDIFTKVFKNFSPEVKDAAKSIVANIITSIVQKLYDFLSDTATNIVKTAPEFFFSSIVALAATCYIAKDYDKLLKFIKNILSEKTVTALSKIKTILKSCVLKILLGYLTLMVITFFELLLGLLIIGVKNALIVALVIAVIDILPVLGTGVVLLPWGIFNIIIGNTGQGIGLMFLYIAIIIIR